MSDEEIKDQDEVEAHKRGLPETGEGEAEGDDVEGHRRRASTGESDEGKDEGEDVEAHRHAVGRHAVGADDKGDDRHSIG